MDVPSSSTIEKIKLEEQDQQTKLKEKREQETNISMFNKAIQDAITQSEKSEQEQIKLIHDTNSLRRQKMLEECRREALTAQLNSLEEQLNNLRAAVNDNVSKVWEKRSLFCQEIHSVSQTCDIWSLLMKPARIEPVTRNVKSETYTQTPSVSENENRLQNAVDRRTKALAERARLTIEPDNGNEFVRLNNALRYSLTKIEEFKLYEQKYLH